MKRATKPAQTPSSASDRRLAMAAAGGVVAILLLALFVRVLVQEPATTGGAPVSEATGTEQKSARSSWLPFEWGRRDATPGSGNTSAGQDPLFLPPAHENPAARPATAGTPDDLWTVPVPIMARYWQRLSRHNPEVAARMSQAASAQRSRAQDRPSGGATYPDDPLWVHGNEHDFDSWWEQPEEEDGEDASELTAEDQEFEAWWNSPEED